VEENSSSSILETKIQICLGSDSPWAKFALAQLLTDLKKIIRNEFQSAYGALRAMNFHFQFEFVLILNSFLVKSIVN
jgi:hypothetical protein